MKHYHEASKMQHYHEALNNARTNPKDTWNLLRQLVPGKQKQNKCHFQNPTVMDASRFVNLPLDVFICITQRILDIFYIVELEGIISCTRGEPKAKFISDCACIYISNINGRFMYKIIGQIQNYFIIAIATICLYFLILFYIKILFYIYVNMC